MSEQNYMPYIDTETALSRLRGNRTLYKKMLQMYLAGNEPAAFEEALAAGDNNRAAEVAHGIKGMTGNLGLQQVFELSAALMTQLRAGDADPATLADYRAATTETRASVERLIEEL